MITEVLSPSEKTLEKAAELLKNGEVVGIPTETVYGLGANALNPSAIKKIFEAKGRPQDNPLILHISKLEMLNDIADEIPPLALTLAEAFWPGSLTMIFKKKPQIPLQTTGGLETAAVRMPNNSFTLSLIDKCGFPIAAPSANLSGSPSPTTAQHVFNDMDGRVPLIVDDGQCSFGLESTVILLKEDGVRILRPGAITAEMLSAYTRVEIDNGVLHQLEASAKPMSPGMKYKHYSPKADVVIVECDSEQLFCDYADSNYGENVYALTFTDIITPKKTKWLVFGDTSEKQANLLFLRLREVDDLNAEKVYVMSPRKDGVGLAVYNRLLRAAGFNIVRA